MAIEIGEAQIKLEIALNKLSEDLQKASQEVEKSIAGMNKEINLQVNTKTAGVVEKEFSKISNVIKDTQEEIDDFGVSTGRSFGIMDDVIREASNSIFGFGTVSSVAMTDAAGAVATMGGSISALAGPIALIVAGVAIFVGEIVLMIKFISDVVERIGVYIEQNEDLTAAIDAVKNAAKVFYDGLKEIYNFLRDSIAREVVNFISGLVDTWNEMNRTTGAGNNLLGSLKNLMTQGLDAVMRVVNAVIGIFKSFSGTTDDSKSKVDDLTATVNTLTSVLNAVSYVIAAVGRGFELMGGWASSAIDKLRPVLDLIKDIVSEYAKITGSALDFFFGSPTQYPSGSPTGDMEPNLPPNTAIQYPDGAGPGTQEGKNEFNQEQNRKSSSPGGGSKQKEVDLVAEEAKLLSEITEAYDRKLQLLYKGTEEYNGLLNKYLEELQVLKSRLAFNENIENTEIRIKKIVDEQNDSFKAGINARWEASKQFVIKYAKEKEAADERAKKEKQLEEELHTAVILNEGDEQKIALNNIEIKYRKERERILKEFQDSKQRTALLEELEKAKAKEIADVTIAENKRGISFIQDGFNAVSNAIKSKFSDVWTSVFGEANSLFEILIQNIYNSLIELASSAIFKTIIDALSGGSGGFLGWIGSLFGKGGFTGHGDPDEIAGAVHYREFVVNELGTMVPGNVALLEAANRGEDIASLVISQQSRNSAEDFSRFNALRNIAGSISTDRMVNVNLGDVKVNASIHKLTGLSDSDWNQIVDDELIPQLSRGLKRVGKEVLDNSIKS